MKSDSRRAASVNQCDMSAVECPSQGHPTILDGLATSVYLLCLSTLSNAARKRVWHRRCTAGYLMNRRRFLRVIGATGAAAVTASCNRISSVVGTSSSPANLVRFPEKTDMIFLTDRPPQLET